MGPQLRPPLCSHSCSTGRAGKGLPQLSEVKEIYDQTVDPVVRANNLMHMYVKRGSMVDAHDVFENMPKRDVVSWNIMIMGYAKLEEGARALEFYARMNQEGVQGSDRTFVGALKACSTLAALEEGKEVEAKFARIRCLEKGRAVHSESVRCGFDSDVFVGTMSVDVYTKCGSMEDARRVFDKLSYHDVASWNAMILGYTEQEDSAMALHLYAQMCQEHVQPTARTFVALLKVYSSLAAQEEGKMARMGSPEKGRAIHSQVVKRGFESNVFVGASLVDMYVKCGSMEDALHVFQKLPHRDAVTWTNMILGYSKWEGGVQALNLYSQMHQMGVQFNARTIIGALKACNSLAALEEEQGDGKFAKIACLEKGRAIQSHAVKSGFESNVFVGTTLVDMFVKCGSMEDARHVFDQLPHRTVVTWTNMILRYAEQEENEEAFRLYAQMQEQGVSPNSSTFAAMVKACANTGALEMGKDFHSQISRVGYETTAIVATSLIDMYAKCGSMANAQQLFNVLDTQDVVPWTAMVAGYAHQGESESVFHLFERMRQKCIRPNRVTFLSLLTVCSHVGLVDRGEKYFQTMTKHYGIIPTIEHYNCMVDLFARAGQLDEALVMVEKMPFQPNVVVWLTVLGACQKWKNVEIGRHAFKNAVRLDETCPTAYILMANIYADAHMLEDRDKIQVMRRNVQPSKKLGQIWRAELGGMVHTFVVGDRRNQQSKDACEKMKYLPFEIEVRYVPVLDCELQEITNERGEALCGNSKKLAIFVP